MALNTIEIDISNQQQALLVDLGQLRRTVGHVLKDGKINAAAVSLALVDDQAIKNLHKKYFGTAAVTDVISFDLRADGETSENLVDCEVVVNAQRALEVAGESSGDALAELHLYVVHGLLHQLGYDDQTEQQERRMHAREDKLLQELGFGKVYAAKGR